MPPADTPDMMTEVAFVKLYFYEMYFRWALVILDPRRYSFESL